MNESHPSATQPAAGSIDAIWFEQRPYLLSVAFRMLGRITDAEDVVQDAFTRLLNADVAAIVDVRAWLVVVVSRLCLDHLGSARVRHESHQDPGSDAFAALTTDADPADRVTLDDSVRRALVVVLEQLSPAERTVFVLREVFQYPFETVAEIVGRSPVACRKLASRAKRRLEASAGEPSRFSVEGATERRVTEEFVTACAHGDLDRLMHVLDADVEGQADFGPDVTRAPVRGRNNVGRNLMRFFGGPSGIVVVSQPVGSQPGALAFLDGQLLAMLAFEIRDGRIVHINATSDAESFRRFVDHIRGRA